MTQSVTYPYLALRGFWVITTAM